jgi:catechol 2,3-dioxygenase-like lactoylglutathione lyase family enzyme
MPVYLLVARNPHGRKVVPEEEMMSDVQFLRTTIVLPVADIYDTTAWYKRALGFETRYIHGSGRRGESEDFANYAIMTRDAVGVHFILDEGGPVWTRSGTGYLYLLVRDVDTVHADVKSRGIPIARELQHENWPARGFNLKDPSGNEIHIEQPD